MTEALEGQMFLWDLLDQDTWSLKMSPDYSVLTKERTLESSSKKRAKSQMKMPLFLDLRGGGQRQDASWETDGAWLGALSIVNTSEHPREDVESRLSQILEEHPHQKYSLSAKACLGILRRSANRRKELPPILKKTLIRQSGGAESLPSNLTEVISVDEKMGQTYIGNEIGNTLSARDYKQPQAVCYGLDRASFNQGQNAQYNFSVTEEQAQTIVAKGPGGVLTRR